MESQQQTSPRPMVKVTYLERQKKNASDVNDFTEASPDGKTCDMKKPASRANVVQEGKSVDNFRVPDPPLRRPGDDLHESSKYKSSPSSKDNKPAHKRSSSSITSLSRVAQQMAASPANKKPTSSTGKATSQIRSSTPETEFDDNASIAESTISISRMRRNEVERIQYFENQPECGNVEPHRAFCTRCGRHVSLGSKQTYTVRPWEKHRARCDQKPPNSPMAKIEPGGDTGSVNEGSGRKTEAERKATLEADERAEIVEADKVKCRKCQKWIRIFAAGGTKYNLHNWNRHQLSCDGSVPSDRVASAERKLRIVNDAQAKAFDPDSVNCLFCGKRVILEGDGDYNLTNWDEHKLQCTSSNVDAKTDKSSVPSLGQTPISASTEVTAESSEGASSANAPSLKRGREEDDLTTDDADARPSIRPRKETYEPPNGEAPGPFGWFMLPFKAFVRGFRESLGGESSS